MARSLSCAFADAEDRQMKEERVKDWYADLQSLAYDVDDILDEFQTADLGRKLHKHQASASKSKVHKLIPTIPTWLKPSTLQFNKEMISKIKDVTKRLKQLETRKGNLQLIGVREPKVMSSRSASTSLVTEIEVFGRTLEKEKVTGMVLSDNGTTDSDGVSVIPIVGMGGMGKTTLAQLVYNDSKHHFDLHAWPCVSEEFDILNVTTVILQSVTGQPCDLKDLNLVQVKLKEKLSGKKFLLVLDDIWNKSYEDWTKLRAPFLAGAPGSKIIVTTRDYGVSSIMRTVPEFALQKLSEDDSLSLLAQHAIGARDFSDHPDLKEIGVEIVKRCDGLPLAIKTTGGLLRSRKMDADDWNDIVKSEIWNLSEGNINGIVPALWLSYYHLPSQLKQCFAYCSLIPKDCEFKAEKIVQLWMAEGFLNAVGTNREVKDCGRMCFKELVSRSFFQESSMKKSHFVMHDLINDLAQSIAGKICFRMEGSHEEMKFPREIRHLSNPGATMTESRSLNAFPKQSICEASFHLICQGDTNAI